MTTNRNLWLGSAALAAALAAQPLAAQDSSAAAPAPAPAAQPAQPADQGIVITARRRAESLIDVPVAVTAYSGEQLAREGAIDITDIGDTTPNVTIEVSRGTNSTLSAFIRGVGQQDPVAGFEQGVGLYLDDVYLNRPQAAVLDIYDVERIEVLRGPQGTLYGRNTIGGAIKYVTRRLSSAPTLSGRAALGSGGRYDGVLTASTPINDLARIGASVASLNLNGFGDNLGLGKKNYNKRVLAGRLSLEVGATEDAMLRVATDYSRDTSQPRGGHRLIPGLQSGAPVLSDVFDSRGALNIPRQKVTAGGVSLHGQVRVAPSVMLKSISAWRSDRSDTPIDFDALPAVDVDVPAIYKNRQFSQEVQALIDKGPLQGVLGAYYLNANAETFFDVRLSTTLPGFAALTSGKVDTSTWALFGDLSYDLTDQLSLSAGGRWTSDRRKARVLRQSLLGGGSTVFGGAGTVLATTSDFTGRRRDTAFTPRLSLSFKPTEYQNLYASWSKGFKGGGFDPRGQSSQAPSQTPQAIYDFMDFDPEKVTSYELGYKGAFFDRRLNLAIALFRADYRDVQVPGSAGCVVGGIATFCGITTNAGKARFKGVEVEYSARLFDSVARAGDRLTLSGSLGYLDAKYLEFITNIPASPLYPGIVGPTNVAANRKVQNTPRWTGSTTLAYATPLAGGGRLTADTTVSYRSASQQFELRTPLLDQPGFALWDANLSYSLPGDRVVFGLHGKNLADKRYIVAGYNFLSQNLFTGDFIRNAAGNVIPTLGREGVLTAYYGPPRQVFASVSFKLR